MRLCCGPARKRSRRGKDGEKTVNRRFLGRYVGDKYFYMGVLGLAIPIMVQNGITNLVSMLDNIMVGRVGTVQMTGVAVANQLLFVFNLCIFGAVSGAGIFVAQFYGKRDSDGVRHTFRFKILSGLLLAAVGIAVFAAFGGALMQLYLRGEGDPAEARASLECAKDYMRVMLVGLLPYAITQCYSGTLRETGSPVPPMVAGITAVCVNLGLNYVLIFGHLGAPAMGAHGAAVATVISRFAELAVVAGWTHRNTARNPFIVGAYRSLHIPGSLVRAVLLRGMPLMFNETMWSMGMAVLNQCYSVKGLDVVSANTICQTFFNVFSVAFMAVGAAIGIILGQQLGAGRFDQARTEARWLISFSLVLSVLVGALYFAFTGAIPQLYNTSDEIRALATGLMRISALAMPLDAFANASYFTLRSGGKTFITILFDSCFVWLISVPTAFILSRYTALPILPLYAICQGENFLKDIVGYIFVHKGIWVRNITDADPETESEAPAAS